MENWEKKFNEGLDESTEKFIMKEFFYILQISGLFSYARGRWFWFMFVHKLLIFLLSICPIIQLVYGALLIKEYHLGVAAQSLHFACGISVSITAITWMTIHRKSLQEILQMINFGFYDYGESFDKTEANNWFQDMATFKKRLFTYLPFHLSLTGFQAMFGSQLLDTIQNTKIEEDYVNGVYMRLPIETWYPFEISNELIRLACMLYEVTVCSVVLFSICGGILLIIFTNYSVNTQIRILILSIEKLEERALYMCKKNYPKFVPTSNSFKLYKNPQFLKEYKYCLRQNHEHHKIILRAKNILHYLQKVPMLLVVLALAFVIACALMIVIKGDKRLAPQVLSLLLLTMEILGIAGICMRGQELSDVSNQLFEAFYTKTKWINCSESIKKSMLILREQTKIPLVCKAGGLTDINWELFASVLSSSYSYFNLIYAMDTSENKT